MLASYAGIFLWSFAAATILPLSSEAPLAYLVHQTGDVLLPVVLATFGNYLGACTTYWLARGAAAAIERTRTPDPKPSSRQRRAFAFLQRWGSPALLLSWVPLLGDALVAAAGALRLPFAAASVWLIGGKLVRYVAVAWAALAV